MKTIVIPQFYRGPSGQKGLYNRQEVGLARAFAALGCRAVVLYPEPGAKAPKVETPVPVAAKKGTPEKPTAKKEEVRAAQPVKKEPATAEKKVETKGKDADKDKEAKPAVNAVVDNALAELQALELACKQTGAPDVLLCRRYIATLAARAALYSRR